MSATATMKAPSYSHVLCEPPPSPLPTYYGRNRQGIVASRDLTSEGTCNELCQTSNEKALRDAQEVFGASRGKELTSKNALAARQALQDSIFGELDVVVKDGGEGRSGGLGGGIDESDIPTKMMDVEVRREKEWENYQRSHRSVHSQPDPSTRSQLVGNTGASSQPAPRPRAFVDVSAGDEPIGRMMIELFSAECPAAVRNFQCLLTGSAGFDMSKSIRLDYLGTPAHYVKKGDCISFGLLGGQSISSTGMPVREENFRYKHQQRGTVSMIASGPNGIGSSFSITFGAAPHLDYVQQVVGTVVDGMAVLDQIEGLLSAERSTPNPAIHITFCGMLSGDRPRGRKLLETLSETPQGREVALSWANQVGPFVWGGGNLKKASAASALTGLDCIARMLPATAPSRPSFGVGVVDVSDVEGSSVHDHHHNYDDDHSDGYDGDGSEGDEGRSHESDEENYYDDE